MNDELGSMLESVLSDPQQMGKIAEMARSLMGGASGAETRKEEPGPVENMGGSSGGSAFSVIGELLGGKQSQSRSTALLMAMRPYMRPEKQEKLDRAMKIARIVHVAGSVMKEYGGDFFGL